MCLSAHFSNTATQMAGRSTEILGYYNGAAFKGQDTWLLAYLLELYTAFNCSRVKRMTSNHNQQKMAESHGRDYCLNHERGYPTSRTYRAADIGFYAWVADERPMLDAPED